MSVNEAVSDRALVLIRQRAARQQLGLALIRLGQGLRAVENPERVYHELFTDLVVYGEARFP